MTINYVFVGCFRYEYEEHVRSIYYQGIVYWTEFTGCKNVCTNNDYEY